MAYFKPLSWLLSGGKVGNTSVRTGWDSNWVSSGKKPPLETTGSGMGKFV